MENSVRQHLLHITADFYRFHADSFDATRQGPWDSWQRVLAQVNKLIKPNSILDVGCGNGRFASFLADNDITGLLYTGIDIEEQLVSKARARHPDKTFHVSSIEDVLHSTHEFDMVVSFGLFHHLPGRQYRLGTLRRFVDLLLPGGIAAISLWQPMLLTNFEAKVCGHHNITGLETNDFLLGWKGDFSHPRYCHHFDDAEIGELIAGSPLELVAQFQGTGNDRSNRYVIFKKS